MHAYLIVGGQSAEERKQTADAIARKLKAKLIEFPMTKIEEARSLKSFTALKVTTPTAVYINSIENATVEALNAFLKNLEEPQKNLYYILTTSFLAGVIPTIVSRCEIIRLLNEPKNPKPHTNSLPDLSVVAKIKDRGEAIELVQNLIDNLHFSLLNSSENHDKIAKNLKISSVTLNNLKANGNVNLQLSNMVINLN